MTINRGDRVYVAYLPRDQPNRLWWQTDRHGGWVCETEQVEKGLKLNLAPLVV